MSSALVTGAARGIGAALVRELRGREYEVVAIDREAGPGVTVADAADVPCALYDLVFLNAGVFGSPSAAWAAAEEEVWRVNYFGPRKAVERLLPEWIKAGHAGRIVFTASLAALLPLPSLADYAASKAALVSYAESLTLDLQRAGSPAGVSVAVPSFTRSGLAKDLPGDYGRTMRALLDEGADANEVARMMVDQALAGRYLLVTHPAALQELTGRWRDLAAGEGPSVPESGRLGDLAKAKY